MRNKAEMIRLNLRRLSLGTRQRAGLMDSDVSELMALCTETLAEFEVPVIAAAVDSLLKSSPWFPTTSELRGALIAAEREMTPQREALPPSRNERRDLPPLTIDEAERIRNDIRILQSANGGPCTVRGIEVTAMHGELIKLASTMLRRSGFEP